MVNGEWLIIIFANRITELKKNMTQAKLRKYIWLLVPAIFSLILLAAHFSRQNLSVVGILVLGLIPMLFIRKKFTLWIVQIALVAGSIEWIRSTLAYIKIRKTMDDDWTRLAIILFSVALFTLISGLILSVKRVRKEYSK